MTKIFICGDKKYINLMSDPFKSDRGQACLPKIVAKRSARTNPSLT
jgi:hypothetical protein